MEPPRRPSLLGRQDCRFERQNGQWAINKQFWDPARMDAAKFGPRRGEYMMHCHKVIHEDHDMMTNFEVGTGGPDPVTTAPKPVSQLPTSPLVKPPSTA